MRLAAFVDYVNLAVHAEFSLQFIVLTSIGLFWIVVCLWLYMLFFRTYYLLRTRYRESRKPFYEPAIEQALMEAPLEDILETLRPKRWGDEEMVQEVLLDSMRHLTGSPFDTLRAAAVGLGFIGRDLRELESRNPHKRGRAMDALGIMRYKPAADRISGLLLREPMYLKLVALRALAAIGDPGVLPSFIEVSDRLQPSLMFRLASLMMEFGPAGRPKIVELVNRHPEGFHPRALADLLRELASHMEVSP